MNYQPAVGIVILNYNGKDDLLKCLDSLEEIDYGDYEILVVDNASEDGSAEAVKRHFPDAAVIRNSENLGFSRGNNVGIRYFYEKDYDYILLLNNDVTVRKDFLTHLVERARKRRDIGIIGPRVYYMDDPDRIYTAGERHSLWFMFLPSTRGRKDHPRFHEARKVDNVVGCAMLVKRKVIERAGMMDEHIYPYYEEVDWCIRARRAGLDVYYEPASVIRHKGGAFWGEGLNKSTAYHKTRNVILLMRKHGNTAQKILFIPQLAAVSLWRSMKALITLRFGVIYGIFKGIMSNLKTYGKLHL